MTAMSSAMYELLAVSAGREQPTTEFGQRVSYYLKCQFASTILFWACLWSVKGAFLAFFFQLTKLLIWPRRAWWAITTITVLAFVGTVITYPLSCTSFTLGKHPQFETLKHLTNTDFRRSVLTSRERSHVLDQSPLEHRTRHSDGFLQSVQRSDVLYSLHALIDS